MSITTTIDGTPTNRWVLSLRGTSRKILFMFSAITPFFGLSDGLRLPIMLGADYFLTVSGVLNLFSCVLFLFLLAHNTKIFRLKHVIPGTFFLLSYLTLIRPGHFSQGMLDWLRVAGWVSTFYIAAMTLDQGEKDIQYLFKLSVFASFAPLLLSFLSYITGGQSQFGWFGVAVKDSTLEGYGVGIASRSAASYLLALLPFVIAVPLLSRKWDLKIVGIFYALASFLAAWFSYGRGVIGASVVFWGSMMLDSRYRKMVMAVLLICLPLLVLADWQTMKLRFTDTPIIKDIAYQEGERVVAGTEQEGYHLVNPSKYSLEQWERSVIWGISLSRWWNAGIATKLFGLGPKSLIDHGRNIFICILGEAGFIAFVFFSLFLGSIFISLWRFFRLAEPSYQKTLAILGLSTFTSFIFAAMFDLPIRSPDIMWYYSLIWGMCFGEYRKLLKQRNLVKTTNNITTMME